MTPQATDVTVTSNIRAELGRQRMTVQDLADKADLVRRSLARKLRDESQLTVLELAKIAHALGVPAESLLVDHSSAEGAA